MVQTSDHWDLKGEDCQSDEDDLAGLVLLTSEWVLTGEAGQVDVVLDHHDVTNLPEMQCKITG